MQRRTITVPGDLDAEIVAALRTGGGEGGTTFSRFFQDAARRHLDAMRAERMEVEARRLDPDEEVATARAARRPRGKAPWGRLG